MSDSEEESCYYGTPLEPYDENSFPKKKPIAIEDQVAKDAQGRRRFHGAFTGGFSAGFFNTAGSLEGWTPTEFRSSRSDKAINNVQVPEDYMDDEDLGEFGIAPQMVRTTNEYSDNRKRKKQHVHSDGPIPGIPVLETLIEAGNESVGYFLMKNMNRRHRRQAQTDIKVYGCAMPSISSDDSVLVNEVNLHECYRQCLKSPKSNSFGLGYSSLDKTHLNLFQPSKLTVRERNNKKLSISGQAFGVGAFENEDEDIYVTEDMTRYDFELTVEAATKKESHREQLLFDFFVISTKKTLFANKISFPPPVIPTTFTGKHKVRRSRFEPIMETAKPAEIILDASIRAKYLGDTCEVSNLVAVEPTALPPQVKKEALDDILSDRFVSAKQKDDVNNILAPVEKFQTDHGTEEMRAAVRMKMFGPLTRITLTWQPCAFLCKRFNVPEPHFENLNTSKQKRTKNLIFEYQKHEEKIMPREPGLEIKASTSYTLPETITLPLTEVKTSTPEVNTNSTETATTEEANTPIDVTDRLHVAEKTDLYKAVFLSSSESESSDTEEKDEVIKNKELIAANIVSEPLVQKIKPMKEGILSNLNFHKVLPPADPPLPVHDNNTYGPRLPNTLLPKVTSFTPNEPVSNIEEWVEKDECYKEKKHKKKHKKEKKKHKHKSKR